MSSLSVRALARSSAYVNAAQFWQMVSRLILTPVVIAKIGLAGYGAWTLVFSLGSYAVMFDAGAGWAYAKVTAELDAQGDYETLSRVVSSGATLVAGFAVVLFAIIWVVRAPLLHTLGVPPNLLAETGRTLAVLSFVVVFDAGPGCVLDVLAGLQRMDLQYRFIIIGSMVEFATTLWLLHAGAGMVALPLGLMSGGLVSIASAWLQCRRLRPELSLSPRRVSRAGVRQVAGLGVRFQGLMLLNTATTQAVRFLISGLFGLDVLAMFHLADRLLSVARTPGVALISPLMPAFAGLEPRNRVRRWRRPFFQASKAVAMAAALPLLFAAIFADPILFAWTGAHFALATWTVRALAPAEFLVLLTGVAGARLRAAGSVRLELLSGVLGGCLSVLGLIVVYPIAGYAGSVVAIACGRVAGSTWFLERFAASMKLGRWRLARVTVLVPALFAPVGLLFGVSVSQLNLLDAGDPRWVMIAKLALLAGGYAAACAPIGWLIGLSSGERVWIVQHLRPMLVRTVSG